MSLYIRSEALATIKYKLAELDRKLRTKIIYNAGPLSGPIKCCNVLGVDYINGDIYYKNAAGDWALLSFGGGGGGCDCVTLPYLPIVNTFLINDTHYTLDAVSNGTFTVTLPTAVGITGRIYNVRNSGTTGIITLQADGAELIHGITTANTQIIDPGKSLQIQSTGSGWIVI